MSQKRENCIQSCIVTSPKHLFMPGSKISELSHGTLWFIGDTENVLWFVPECSWSCIACSSIVKILRNEQFDWAEFISNGFANISYVYGVAGLAEDHSKTYRGSPIPESRN